MIARWLIVGCIACQHEEPKHAPLPPPPAVTIARPDAAPAPPPVAEVATWSSKPPDSPRAKWPACITTSTRDIQYADTDDHGAPRFCLWSHLDLSRDPIIGCWRVDLDAGTFVAETGVWFSALVPEREDGVTRATLDNGTSASVAGKHLVISRAGKVVQRVTLPGAGNYIVLAGKAGLVAVSIDGRVLFVDDAGKITRAIVSPACKA